MSESGITFFQTPLGLMWLWASPQGLCGAGFGESVPHDQLKRQIRYGLEMPRPVTTPLLERSKSYIDAYFNWRRKTFDLELDLRGTPFQKSVWSYLQGIPYGETVTYGEIAMALGNPRASQAVGQAVGANPVTLIVPCHRVVGFDGSLTGYGGGLPRKSALLELEQMGLQLRMPIR